jgi:ABC-type ATPase with predicted acetyltransferase domain
MGITTGPGRLDPERLPTVDARAGAAGTRIDLDGVCRWFGAGDTVVKAVDDVNLHVDETAFVVVLGPSGSGKTTLLNLLAWLTATTIAGTMPEIGVTAAVSAGTVAAALLLGAGTVAAAPLFTLRRLRRIDVPSALRVAE